MTCLNGSRSISCPRSVLYILRWPILWGLPFAEEIIGTVVAVDTFLGVILGISTAQYTKKQAAEASKTK